MTNRTLQDLFVDRLKQLDRFRRSFEGQSTKRIIVVTAGPGMGKSWLLKQFLYESRNQGASTVLIDFSDGQAYDPLMLVRRFRDSLGAEYFNGLTQAINTATTPQITLNERSEQAVGGAVTFGSGSQFGDVQVGDVAGRNIIKDNFFIVQADNPLVVQAMEDRITSVFFTELLALAQQTRVVFFFDSYERNAQQGDGWISNTADRWITRELLTRIRDERLPNVLVVLGGRRVPPFGIEWNNVLGTLALEPFTEHDVAEYLRSNRGLRQLTDAEVQTLFSAVQGSPQLLGIIGDNLEQSNAQQIDDDVW